MTIVAKDLKQLEDKLKYSPESKGQQKNPEIWFLFTGQGSQYFGMAKNPYNTTEFRTEFQKVSESLEKELDVSLMYCIWENESLLEETLYCQPAMYCLQVVLSHFWKKPWNHARYCLGSQCRRICCCCLGWSHDI